MELAKLVDTLNFGLRLWRIQQFCSIVQTPRQSRKEKANIYNDMCNIMNDICQFRSGLPLISALCSAIVFLKFAMLTPPGVEFGKRMSDGHSVLSISFLELEEFFQMVLNLLLKHLTRQNTHINKNFSNKQEIKNKLTIVFKPIY